MAEGGGGCNEGQPPTGPLPPDATAAGKRPPKSQRKRQTKHTQSVESEVHTEICQGPCECAQPPLHETPPPTSAVRMWKVRQYDDTAATWQWRFPIDKIDKEDRAQHLSQLLPLGKFHWRIMVMDKHWLPQVVGGPPGYYVSVYVDLLEAHSFPITRHLMARFQIVLHNIDPIRHKTKTAKHAFSKPEYDRGFASMGFVNDLLTPENGWIHTTEDGFKHLLIEASVKESADPTRCLLPMVRAPVEAGIAAPIVRANAPTIPSSLICLLQILYHLTSFRKSIYKLSTQEEVEKLQQQSTVVAGNGNVNVSIPLAFQRLFCAMQSYNSAVDIAPFIQAFGKEWAEHPEALQEAEVSLLEALKQAFPNEGEACKPFFGHAQTCIKCKNVDYIVNTPTAIRSISLPVEECQTVYDSLNKETEVVTLDGDNQYMTPNDGLQDATKQTVFVEFPTIMFLHMQRFVYNLHTERVEKVHTHFEYYDELALTPHKEYVVTSSGQVEKQVYKVSSGGDRNGDMTYTLFAVIVHSGMSIPGGHYYVYIKNVDANGNMQWLKYDHAHISKVSVKHATEDNFGAPTPLRWWEDIGLCRRGAVMLTYIKKSEFVKIVHPMSRTEIPMYIRKFTHRHRKEEKQQHEEREKAHLLMHFKIVTEADLLKDIPSHIHDLYPLASHATESFRQDMRWSEFVKKLQEIVVCRNKLCIGTVTASEEHQTETDKKFPPIRLWEWNERTNHTVRPDNVVNPSKSCTSSPVGVEPQPEDDMMLHDIFGGRQYDKHDEKKSIHLFVETLSAHKNYNSIVMLEKQLPVVTRNSCLLFFRFYEPMSTRIKYLTYGIFQYHNDTKVVPTVLPLVLEVLKLPPATQLECYEEIRKEWMSPIEPTQTFLEAELSSGDVLVFQHPKEKYPDAKCPSVQEWWSFMDEQVTIQCMPALANKSTVVVECSKKDLVSVFFNKLILADNFIQKDKTKRPVVQLTAEIGGSVIEVDEEKDTVEKLLDLRQKVTQQQSVTTSPTRVQRNISKAAEDGFYFCPRFYYDINDGIWIEELFLSEAEDEGDSEKTNSVEN